MKPRSTSHSPTGVADELREARIKSEDLEEEALRPTKGEDEVKKEFSENGNLPTSATDASLDNWSPRKNGLQDMSSPEPIKEPVEVVGGDVTVKQEPGQPLKLARSSTQKVPMRSAQLYDHLPDATAEATKAFQLMTSCSYTPKYLGDTEHAMECDCAEEWGESDVFDYQTYWVQIDLLANFCSQTQWKRSTRPVEKIRTASTVRLRWNALEIVAVASIVKINGFNADNMPRYL